MVCGLLMEQQAWKKYQQLISSWRGGGEGREKGLEVEMEVEGGK